MGVVVNDNGMSLSEWHELHNKDSAGGGTGSSVEVDKLKVEIEELKTKVDKQDEIIEEILPKEGDVIE